MVKKSEEILKIDSIKQFAEILGYSHSSIIFIATNYNYDSFKIKKKSGGYRTILVPDAKHKIIQRRINDILQDVYKNIDPGCVYGFNNSQPESIKANAKNHVNKKSLLNIDIKDFFPSITSAMLKDMFMQKPFNYPEKLATLISMLSTYKNSLPTGAPSSPIISNFVFLSTDKKLLKLANKYNLTYTRYADDLSFSTDTEFSEEIISEITKIINQFGFELNHKKFRIQNYYNRQTVTGITVNEKVNINRKYIRNIRAILHNIESKGLVIASKRYYNLLEPDSNDIQKFILSIRGKIEFIGFIRGENDKIYNNLSKHFYSFYEYDTYYDYPF